MKTKAACKEKVVWCSCGIPALPLSSSATWACALTSLSLSFLIYKMGITVASTPLKAVANTERPWVQSAWRSVYIKQVLNECLAFRSLGGGDDKAGQQWPQGQNCCPLQPEVRVMAEVAQGAGGTEPQLLWEHGRTPVISRDEVDLEDLSITVQERGARWRVWRGWWTKGLSRLL